MADEKTIKEEKPTHLRFWGIPRIWKFIRPYGKHLLIMVVLGILTGLADILYPMFQRYAIDEYIANKHLDNLWLFILLYLAILIAQAANIYSTYKANYVETYIGRDMKSACFDHLQTLSFSYFNRNSVGYLQTRVLSDTARISGVIAWDLMDGIWNIAYLIGSIIMMLSINVKLALCVIVIVPVLTLAVAIFEKRQVAVHRKVRETNSQISGKFNDGIVGILSIKTLGVEKRVADEFSETTSTMRRYSSKFMHYRALFRSVISFAASLALALVLWYGGMITTVEGIMLVGTLSVFMSYAQGMMEPVLWIVSAISDMITVQVNIERVTNLLAAESDVNDTPEVIEKYGDTFSPKRENWEEIGGDIEFRDVSFKYPDGDEYVLEHFDLKVPKGTNIAIVGETGAGKSTLVNLVCRFFEPTSGAVLIDGRDVRERSQLWLHSQIGYVLQTPHLFSGSVADNLRYGNMQATEEEMWAALRRISADKVVEKMGNGLESDVGEGGDMLSTGEKQLLSFARVLLADPQIFVLDEATSSVDTETEKLIQEATETVMKGRTSFIIAHRLSTIRNADVILSVRDGKIIESGTHQELMAAKGYYYNLYTHQFSEEQTMQVLKDSGDEKKHRAYWGIKK